MIELETKIHEDLKSQRRAFSWLKVPKVDIKLRKQCKDHGWFG